MNKSDNQESSAPEPLDPIVERKEPNKINPILLLFLLFPLLGIIAAIATGRPSAATGTLVPPPAVFTPTTRIGSPAPDFTLQTPAGANVTLSSLRGQWVFLNFWATWCPPCRKEMPTFQQFLNGKFGDHTGKVTVLTVDRVETPDKVVSFMNDLGINVPVVLDADARVNNAYGVLQLPVTFVIDPTGVVRYEQFGEMTPDLLRQYLADQGYSTTSEF